MKPSAILAAQVGPFKFDHTKDEVTLEPGTYHLAHAITFGVVKQTRIAGVSFIGSGGGPAESILMAAPSKENIVYGNEIMP